MGYDMRPRGIKHCGPSRIKNHLDELTSSDNNRAICLVTNLLKTYKTCPMNNKKVMCCFTDALQYKKSTLYGYIHSQEPTIIEYYLTASHP